MRTDLTRSERTCRLSDVEVALLARFRAGEREDSFQELVRGQLGPLIALARRVTGDSAWADDLVQEALVRAYRGLDAFRGESSLRTWLFRILVRLSKEPSRWQRSEPAAPLSVEVPDVLGIDPHDELVERELRDRLEEALERLTPRQRAAFHLRAVEGMDYRAIGAALDCTPVAARMLVLGARKKVMARMERHLEW
ncbi:MAG: RNA polymerase sigma factor [Planctomycetes bacterium]|nr:RNA polymerase sigma factor [Planctomycetota bacterium]